MTRPCASGQTLRTLQRHTDSVSAVALSADGRRALSGSYDDTLHLWDLGTGQTLRTLEGHTDPVFAVALSPDGCRALSGSSDNTLRLWDLSDGKELLTFTVDGDVRACTLGQDNRTIVAGDGLGRVHFLRLVESDPTKPAVGETKIQLLHREE